MTMIRAYDEFWNTVINQGWNTVKEWAFNFFVSITVIVSIQSKRLQISQELNKISLISNTDLERIGCKSKTLRFDASLSKNSNNGKLEIVSVDHGIYKHIDDECKLRRFKVSLGTPIRRPTPAYEDNDEANSQIKQEKMTPRTKNFDVDCTNRYEIQAYFMGVKRVMTQIHEQGLIRIYVAIFTLTGRNKNDMNTNLQKINMAIVGYQYYPPEGSEHHLDQYNVETHRESFMIDVKPEKYCFCLDAHARSMTLTRNRPAYNLLLSSKGY